MRQNVTKGKKTIHENDDFFNKSVESKALLKRMKPVIVDKIANLTKTKQYHLLSLKERRITNKEKLREKKREKYKLLKKKLLTPIIMPVIVKSEYEKIRDDIIAQRKKEWIKFQKQWNLDKE